MSRQMTYFVYTNFNISPPHTQMPKVGHALTTQRGRRLKQKTAKNASKYENFSSLVFSKSESGFLWKIFILGKTIIATHLIEEKSPENSIELKWCENNS